MPTVPKPLRIRALEIAEKEVGVREEPLGSNWGPRVSDYLEAAGWLKPAPWCMAFVVWAYRKAGRPLTHPGQASVGFFENWAKQHGYLVERPERPYRGDLVCLRWDSDDWPDHVAFVERVLALRFRGGHFVGLVRTVEGNSNDRVEKRLRWIGASARFARIPGTG